jgi:hypothetical protein
MQQECERLAALPPSHTFVVQFAADVQVDRGRVAGRVEHLVSRQATRFQSLEALLAFMAQVLRQGPRAGETAS